MDIEQAIGEQLRQWGFSVQKIPESKVQGEKCPDYRVSDSSTDTYLVEVKPREDDPTESEQRHKTLGRGEVYGEHRALVRSNTVSGIIRDAYLQLKDYGEPECMRVAFLCATDRAQEAKYEQFKAALYGSTPMSDLEGDGYRRPCYFFKNSDFFRYKEVLDAAVVSTLRVAQLCLNPHSPKFKQVWGSALAQKFGTAICNPVAEEAAGDAYLVDSTIDRGNSEEVLNYLRDKYQAPKLFHVDLGWHSGTVLEPPGA